MDPTAILNRREAERSLEIATKLLAVRDLVGSKRFAELALDADPKLPDDRADQILAVADVLLASQKRVNNHLDWYSILQIPRPDPLFNNPSNFYYLLKCHYRRLSLLLHPDRNRSPGADSAFKLIVDAYNVLSDPSKRSLFDDELKISENLSSTSAAAGPTEQQTEPLFWTLCPSCCYVHQYARAYLNLTLRCQTCRRAFNATELQAQPTIVPGTDMYYATWGFFPLGFANPSSTDWKPFQSVYPASGSRGAGGAQQNQGPPDRPGGGGAGRGRGPVGAAGRNKKKTARKKVIASGIKNMIFGAGDQEEIVADLDDHDVGEPQQRVEEARGININEAAKGIGEDDIEMIIDLDATDEMLGNLQNLPFLKDEAINIQIP